MKVPIKLLENYDLKNWGLPVYAHKGDACVDVFAAIEKDIDIYPGERKLIKTGICLRVPYGYEIQIRPRSGLSLNSGITVLNSPGTIDIYTGEIGIILINLDMSSVKDIYMSGNEEVVVPNNIFKVKRGDKIAQMKLSKVEEIEWVVLDNLGKTDRGSDGFGSTGL